MSTDLTQPTPISPEDLEVANTYLATLSVPATAATLDIPIHEITEFLDKPIIKRYLDAIFLEQGYMNRFTLQNTLNLIISKKLEECEESEIYSTKDIADLLKLAHTMRIEELKVNSTTPTKQINIQNNNYGENYSNLLDRIINAS